MMQTVLAAINYHTQAQPNVTLDASYSASSAATGGGTATSTLKVTNLGDIIRNIGLGDSDIGDWTDDNASLDASLFQIVVTSKSAVVTGPDVGTYNAGTTREWSVSSSGGSGLVSGSVTLRIEEIANTSNFDTTTLNLSATSDP